MKTGNALMNEIRRDPGPAFWWLGQSGFAVKLGGKLLFLDPYLSPSPERLVPPLLGPEQIAEADLILGSHDHLDHIDREVWRKTAALSEKPKFILPQAVLDAPGNVIGIPAGRLTGLDDGAAFREGGITITGVAAAHEFLTPDRVTGRFPCLGFVVEGGGTSLYHAGDCCVYDGLRAKLMKFGRFGAAFLPINGRDGARYRAGIIGNMTFQEAADLAGDLRPGLAVPMHYEMFSCNRSDPALFTDYLAAKYPKQNFWAAGHGERAAIPSAPGR